jgi:sporulation protein YlmC with PRC-barrel domain
MMNWKALNGKEVLDADGYNVGKIDDLDLDAAKGIVNHLIMKSGFSTKHAITLDKIMSIGDKIILKIRKADLSIK